jgi:hypothetical protein
MRALFTWIGNAFTNLISLILPVFSGARQSKAIGRGVRWLLHFLLLGLILVGLYYLNRYYFEVQNYLPGKHWIIRYNYLGITFLLFYALVWLSWWLWKLLSTEENLIEFPDITAAWEEASETLHRNGIDVRDLPLFLVVGRTEGPPEHLFQAAHVQFTLRQVPGRQDAPLHVYATAQAIYVTCQGCSLLGRQASHLAGGVGDSDGPEAAQQGEDWASASMGGRTLMPGAAGAGAGVSQVQEILERANRERRPLSGKEKRQLRALTRKDKGKPAPVRDPEEVDKATARFEHFCRLVVRDRWPYCAVNGILLLLPFAALDENQDALDTGSTVRHDLEVARRVLQVNSPTIALVSDLESATGFGTFLSRFNESERRRRVGQRCPLVPHLQGRSSRSDDDDEAQALMFASLSSWLCNSVVPGWIYKNFDMEEAAKKVGERSLVRSARNEASLGGTPAGEGGSEAAGNRPGGGSASSERSAAVRTNAQLFLFMHELWERQQRLGQLLAKGLATEGGEPILFGGCYLGGTGSDAQKEQAFVPGVFKRLSEEENYVSWTMRAIQDEESVQRWIGISQVVLGLLALLLVGLLGYMIFGKGTTGPTRSA